MSVNIAIKKILEYSAPIMDMYDPLSRKYDFYAKAKIVIPFRPSYRDNEQDTFIPRFYDSRAQSSNIPFSLWNGLLERLISYEMEYTYVTYVKRTYGNTGYYTTQIDDGEESFSVRYNQQPIDDDMENWTRYFISYGTDNVGTPSSIITSQRNIIEEDYNVYTFMLEQYGCNVELVEVLSDGRTSYDIVINLINARSIASEYTNLIKATRYIVRRLFATEVYYNTLAKELVNMYINTNLALRDYDGNRLEGYQQKSLLESVYSINRNILNTPRVMGLTDLQYGSIIGTNIVYGASDMITSIKRFLVLSHVGIWLIYPPYEYNLLDYSSKVLFTKEDLCIFEVENIPEEMRNDMSNKEKYWLYVTDCLIVNGYDIRGLDQNKRLRYGMNSVTDMLQRSMGDITFPNHLVSFTWKSIFSFATQYQFYTVVNDMLLNKNTLPYKSSGIVFSPINYQYNADVLTWEDVNPDTKIAFRVRQNGFDTLLFSVQDDVINQSKEIQFKGSKQYPFDHNIHLDANSIPATEYDNVVYMVLKDKKLTYDSIAGDIEPYNYSKARDIWERISNPITTNMILGKGLDSAILYHDLLVSNLYKLNSTGMLLDLSINGGKYVQQWRGYDLVVVVDDDEDRLTLLKKRAVTEGFIITSPKREKIEFNNKLMFIIETKAWNTQKIREYVKDIEAKYQTYKKKGTIEFDCVSVIDSWGVYWKDLKRLSGVIDTIRYTIKSGGRLIWKMLDYDAIQRDLGWFHNIDNRKLILTYDNFSLYVQEDMSCIVSYPDKDDTSIEYMTRYTDMIALLGSDFTIEYTRRADQVNEQIGPLLGEKGYKYSSLYLYGTMIYSYIKEEQKPTKKKKKQVSSESESEKELSSEEEEVRPQKPKYTVVKSNIRAKKPTPYTGARTNIKNRGK